MLKVSSEQLKVLASKSGFVEFDENLYIGRVLQDLFLPRPLKVGKTIAQDL